MSIDPGPHPRHVLWGCSKLYAHIMYPGYSGFKSSQIFSNLAKTFHSVITLTISLSKLFHLCLLKFRGRCLPKIWVLVPTVYSWRTLSLLPSTLCYVRVSVYGEPTYDSLDYSILYLQKQMFIYLLFERLIWAKCSPLIKYFYFKMS